MSRQRHQHHSLVIRCASQHGTENHAQRGGFPRFVMAWRQFCRRHEKPGWRHSEALTVAKVIGFPILNQHAGNRSNVRSATLKRIPLFSITIAFECVSSGEERTDGCHGTRAGWTLCDHVGSYGGRFSQQDRPKKPAPTSTKFGPGTAGQRIRRTPRHLTRLRRRTITSGKTPVRVMQNG